MRQEDWPTELSSLIERRMDCPFDFPEFNCLMFAFETIEAMIGEDLSGDYRGKYKSEAEAKKLLKKVDNVSTSQELLIKKLGQELKPIAFGRMGDIIFLNEKVAELGDTAGVDLFGPIPGVCYGTVSYFVGEFGLVPLPTLQMSSALWVS